MESATRHARQLDKHRSVQPTIAVLVRKGTDLRVHTKADLKRIQDTLNQRPRPTLDLETPAERLAALLANAA